MWHELAKLDDIAPGGLKYAKAGAREVCLCRVGDQVYAVSRRCGHQNAPLDQGALDGWVLTCPLHNAQFDVRSGKNLSWANDHDYGPTPCPSRCSASSPSRHACRGRRASTIWTATPRVSRTAPCRSTSPTPESHTTTRRFPYGL